MIWPWWKHIYTTNALGAEMLNEGDRWTDRYGQVWRIRAVRPLIGSAYGSWFVYGTKVRS